MVDVIVDVFGVVKYEECVIVEELGMVCNLFLYLLRIDVVI